MFDFDGVFVQTLEHAFSIHSYENPNFHWEDFKAMSDGNFHEEYQKRVTNTVHISPKNFGKLYNSNLQFLSIEDKMRSLIRSLSKDYLLYIISSTESVYIKAFLTKEKIEDCFLEILGSDIHRSKVVKIKSVLDQLSVNPKNCIFVTDTVGDIKEACICGVASIAVTWGLHEKERLEKENPFSIVDTPEQLHQTIENFFIKI